jgi:hypothetical protein
MMASVTLCTVGRGRQLCSGCGTRRPGMTSWPRPIKDVVAGPLTDGRESAQVLHHDEQAVLAGVELALEAGAPTKTYPLNVLHRLLDSKTDLPPVNAL